MKKENPQTLNPQRSLSTVHFHGLMTWHIHLLKPFVAHNPPALGWKSKDNCFVLVIGKVLEVLLWICSRASPALIFMAGPLGKSNFIQCIFFQKKFHFLYIYIYNLGFQVALWAQAWWHHYICLLVSLKTRIIDSCLPTFSPPFWHLKPCHQGSS